MNAKCRVVGQGLSSAITYSIPDNLDVMIYTRRCFYIMSKLIFTNLALCIDNLTKGASGQAVQAMNIRFGLAESAGLD